MEIQFKPSVIKFAKYALVGTSCAIGAFALGVNVDMPGEREVSHETVSTVLPETTPAAVEIPSWDNDALFEELDARCLNDYAPGEDSSSEDWEPYAECSSYAMTLTCQFEPFEPGEEYYSVIDERCLADKN